MIISHNKKLLYTIILLFILLIGLLYVINQRQEDEGSDLIIGGERDEHGCLGPAGYTWNNTKQKCVREWEEENKIYCKEEDRNSDMCTFLHDPVCANAYEINSAITKPNACIACQNSSLEYYVVGECEK